MKNLYDNAAIRQMERAAFAREESFAVMTRAAAAVAEQARYMLNGDKKRQLFALAGPGNNGGDALAAATQLQNDGYAVRVVFVGDEHKLPPDAKKAFAQWQSGGGKMTAYISAAEIDAEALILDGLLGIGLGRATSGRIADLIRQIQPHWRQTLSIDIPSGIDGDSGARCGEAVTARRTVTFFAAKPGLYTGAGVQAAGEVVIADLGNNHFPPPCGVLLDEVGGEVGGDLGLAWSRLRRTKNTHKGTYGAAAIVGGADGMVGALVLACRAAVRLGAGKVYAACVADNPPLLDWRTPEVMWRAPAEIFTAADCIAIGPGLGTTRHAADILRAAIAAPLPLLADADALNLLAADDSLATKFTARKEATIMTPHPAEAARLLHCSAAEINQNRIGAARQLARQFGAVAVLKGAGSIIAAADDNHSWAICAAGNAGLAQAGSGDVLGGIIAALLAQTADAVFAARAGVWLHATAADDIAAANGVIGLDINQLATVAARRLNHIIAAQ